MNFICSADMILVNYLFSIHDKKCIDINRSNQSPKRCSSYYVIIYYVHESDTHFNRMTSSLAAYVTGGVIVPGAAGGIVIGGLIVRVSRVLYDAL